jgi:hypothetical protein
MTTHVEGVLFFPFAGSCLIRGIGSGACQRIFRTYFVLECLIFQDSHREVE